VTIDELRRQWALRRDEWARLGVRVEGAKLAEEILAFLEQLGEADSQSVSLKEAAEITGRTADHLGCMIRRHQLPNVGRKHAPRIPVAALDRLGRKHLGRKHRPRESAAGSENFPMAAPDALPYNPTADARSLLRRRARGGSHGA
jgi:hypothetical protein